MGTLATNTPDQAALSIALYARFYRLLADRREFLDTDTGARIDKAWTADAPGSLPLLDRVMVEGMTELDRLCGYAVAVLRQRTGETLLDVLGVLERERLLAVYFALPRDRRHVVLKDPTWAYLVQGVDPEAVARASVHWDDLPAVVAFQSLESAAQQDVFKFAREASRLRAGLDHELTDDQRRCVVTAAHQTEAPA